MKTLEEWLARKPAGKKPRKPLKRTVRPRQVSKKRVKQRSQYRGVHKEHMFAHPLCQLTIARFRLDETEVLDALREWLGDFSVVIIGADQFNGFWFGDVKIPAATEIHHRNKAAGERLTDKRWFASAGRDMHDHVENNKEWARVEGFLLPLEADKDGRLPNGTQCLTTDEWIAGRHRLQT